MIDAIVQRLKDQAPALHSVGVAEDMEALSKGTAPRNGATFVLPFSDRGGPNTRMSGGFRQLVEAQFLVAFVIRRHDDAKGGKRASSFDLFKDQIEAALAGWSPDDEENDPFELAAARAATMGNGVTIYVQTWRTTRYITGAST